MGQDTNFLDITTALLDKFALKAQKIGQANSPIPHFTRLEQLPSFIFYEKIWIFELYRLPLYRQPI